MVCLSLSPAGSEIIVYRPHDAGTCTRPFVVFRYNHIVMMSNANVRFIIVDLDTLNEQPDLLLVGQLQDFSDCPAHIRLRKMSILGECFSKPPLIPATCLVAGRECLHQRCSVRHPLFSFILLWTTNTTFSWSLGQGMRRSTNRTIVTIQQRYHNCLLVTRSAGSISYLTSLKVFLMMDMVGSRSPLVPHFAFPYCFAP